MPDALLATVSDLGLLVDEDLADDDPKSLLYLRIASGIVRSYCHQYLSIKNDDSVVLTTYDGGSVFLPELPIIAIASVSPRAADGTFAALAATTYDVDESTGRIQLRRWAGPTSTRWQVIYSHGYAELPEPITDAVLGLCARSWLTPIAVENERIGQRSIKYAMEADGLSADEQLGLGPYVVPEIR